MNSILSVADKTLRTGHITMCTIHGGFIHLYSETIQTCGNHGKKRNDA